MDLETLTQRCATARDAGAAASNALAVMLRAQRLYGDRSGLTEARLRSILLDLDGQVMALSWTLDRLQATLATGAPVPERASRPRR